MLTFCNGTGTICHNRNLLINLCETFIWILITEKMAFQFIPNKSLWTVSAKKEKTCEKKKKQLDSVDFKLFLLLRRPAFTDVCSCQIDDYIAMRQGLN